MTEKLDKYILDVQIDNETGEEHCTVLKTDGTTNMANWIEILSAMYTHHSVFEPLIKELNNLSDENEQLEKENKELKAFKEKVFEWIDGEMDSVKESCNVLMTSNEAEAIMDTLIELKNELSGDLK